MTMAIYESKGFGSLLYLYTGVLEPFEYVANFRPKQVPTGADLEQFKRTQAPYCISGRLKAEKNGTIKRNNGSLIYRDLIFLDYDNIDPQSDFHSAVARALNGFSYIIYPTIKHTPHNPRYRLVVKPEKNLSELIYKSIIKEIADKIGLPFDESSLTWSQLQGLPVTTGDPKDYKMTVVRGKDYPVPQTANQQQGTRQHGVNTNYHPNNSGELSITMRVVNTLLNGFGDEGGRNVALTRFVGLLLNKYVNCNVKTAYDLANIANSVTAAPLPQNELNKTFESIVRAEIKKRGG